MQGKSRLQKHPVQIGIFAEIKEKLCRVVLFICSVAEIIFSKPYSFKKIKSVLKKILYSSNGTSSNIVTIQLCIFTVSIRITLPIFLTPSLVKFFLDSFKHSCKFSNETILL